MAKVAVHAQFSDDQMADATINLYKKFMQNTERKLDGTWQVQQSHYAWLYFALMTVFTWGLYGVLLHTGQLSMADPVNGRYKAFLFVGIAYFITAVLAPGLVLLLKGASWVFPAKGMVWSLIAGIAGAAVLFVCCLHLVLAAHLQLLCHLSLEERQLLTQLHRFSDLIHRQEDGKACDGNLFWEFCWRHSVDF